jgi:hypothetical protein
MKSIFVFVPLSPGEVPALTPFMAFARASNRNLAMSVRIEGPSEYFDGGRP